MPHTVRRSLLLGLTVLVALALTGTIIAVLRADYEDIARKAQKELDLAARVFSQLMDDRHQQLASHAGLLAGDLRFKQAIAKHAITRSDRDIIALLKAHQDSIGADLGLLVDYRGRVTSSAPPEVFSPALLERLRSSELSQTYTLVVIDEVPFQLVFAPVQASNWIAWVGMGYRVDRGVVQSLRSVTGMRATLLFQRSGGPIGSISTLPDTLAALLNAHGGNLPASTATFIGALEENNWLSSAYPLLQSPEANLSLILSTSIGDELRAFESLRRQLFALSVLILLLAGAIAIWFSDKARHAIRLMAVAAQRIAHGEGGRPMDDRTPGAGAPSSVEAAFKAMQRAIEEREKRFDLQAQSDPLTGLQSRQHFEMWLRSQLGKSDPPPACGLMLLQLCGLRQISDIYGLDAANQLLMAVADRSGDLLGPADRMARFESDQFFIYIDGLQEDGVAALAERMKSLFEKGFAVADRELHLEIRAGMVLCPEHGSEYPALLRRCNIALSQTFINHNTFELYQTGQDALHLRKIQIIHALQHAAERDEFEIMVQPQLQLSNGRINRAEALLRWQHRSRNGDTSNGDSLSADSLGKVSPAEFIPLAERAGHIGGITLWLVDQVCDQLLRWRDSGLDVGISINVSVQDLVKDTFTSHLADRLRKLQLQSGQLLIEVTETAMMERPRQVVRNLRRLHRLGVAIAMDDFGTGFSSLSQLKALPLDELKIDQAFILNLDKDEDDQKIVMSAIEMAHNLKLQVVAEGVENATSLHILEAMGCDLAQGNFIGKAMKIADFEAWLPTAGVRELRAVQSPRARLAGE